MFTVTSLGLYLHNIHNNLRTVRARQGLANLFFVKKKIKFDYIPGEIQNRHESAYNRREIVHIA